MPDQFQYPSLDDSYEVAMNKLFILFGLIYSGEADPLPVS